jgi:hypothetical protein
MTMSHAEYEAAIAAFIRAKGVTRCPTACVVRTQGTVSPADQEELRRRADQIESRRGRRRSGMPIVFGRKAIQPH